MSRREDSHFPTTRWSLIALAREADPNQRRAALGEVLKAYWGPLTAYLRACNGSAGNEEDLLQGFVASQVLERELLDAANPTKGRFRTYLLTALSRYVTKHNADLVAQKRGSGRVISLEEACDLPADDPQPYEALQAAWARQVVEQAVHRMRQATEASKRPEMWEIFQCRVLRPLMDGSPPVPYAQLVSRLAIHSPVEASNLLVTAKRTFIRCLREVVREYEPHESRIDEEIADLRRILATR